ncbi:hypothetical protein [Methylobacterium soli]|uniref:YHS domain-containing protein n=1 Tax=Methylobacterium soli TaxID=553447 RepID=A0A6L3T536_9HYPH|nr:hypothetical protein [Methylobacterium soli]KAB1081441.1 hypothetical protein F6X53_02720 [Methylobacterium soli]
MIGLAIGLASGTAPGRLPAALSAEAGAPAEPGRGAVRPETLPAVDLLALRGFDAVSDFLPGGPVAGCPAFEVTWRGRVWRFDGAANRDAFRRDPEAYAPRLGGYDPVGVVEGRPVDADPLVFARVAMRLYLFRDAGRRALAGPDLAARAEARWPGLRALTDSTPPD